MRTNYFYIASIVVLLLVAGSCRYSANVSDTQTGTQDGGAVSSGVSGSSSNITAMPTEAKSAVLELPDGAAVPAKRENLTAADRAAFLRAIGLTDYADNSMQFVERWNESSGTPLKNAGMTFFDLGAGRYIVQTTVDRGANQSTSVYALYQETTDNRATAKKLELDSYYPDENGKIIKTTDLEKVGAPDFDAPSKILTITAASRGIGGCGSRMKYKIVGDRAETVEARYQKCTNDELIPPEKWELLSLSAADQPEITMPAAKSPGISVCSEGAGGNGLEIKEADFAHMKPAHAAVLKRWLCFQKDNMRPMRAEKNSLSSQKNFRRDHPNLDPFYAVGDFNNNGTEDFAVLLSYFAPQISPETKRPLNALAVFEMSSDSAKMNPPAAFFSNRIDSLFIITGTVKGQLAIASYPSDDGFLLVPQGKTYAVKAMLDDI